MKHPRDCPHAEPGEGVLAFLELYCDEEHSVGSRRERGVACSLFDMQGLDLEVCKLLAHLEMSRLFQLGIAEDDQRVRPARRAREPGEVLIAQCNDAGLAPITTPY